MKSKKYVTCCCAECRELDGWYCLLLHRDVDDDIDQCMERMPDCPYHTYETTRN